MHEAKILPALSAAWSSPIPTSRARARAAGPRLPAFLEAQLLDGFIGDGYRNAYAAFLFDGRMAVNGAFVFDGHMAVNDTFILMRKGEPTLFGTS